MKSTSYEAPPLCKFIHSALSSNNFQLCTFPPNGTLSLTSIQNKGYMQIALKLLDTNCFPPVFKHCMISKMYVLLYCSLYSSVLMFLQHEKIKIIDFWRINHCLGLLFTAKTTFQRLDSVAILR